MVVSKLKKAHCHLGNALFLLFKLARVGFKLGYTNRYLDAKLSYGLQVTGNRGLDSNGNDAEGEESKHQIWLQIDSLF